MLSLTASKDYSEQETEENEKCFYLVTYFKFSKDEQVTGE